MNPEPSDADLVKRARDGDWDAFGDLIRRHHARVAGLCASLLDDRSETDDAAQEVFLKAFRFLGGFQGDSEFSTWLYRIATNHCLDVRRKVARRKTSSLDALLEESDGEGGGLLLKEAETRNDLAEDVAVAKDLLESLPQGARDALALRIQGLPYNQIAKTLECSLDAVKSRLRRARAELSDRMRHISPSTTSQQLKVAGEHDEPRKR